MSYPPFNLWPVRETSPFLRVLTGALFGLMNAWLAFPYLETSMREVRQEAEQRIASATHRAAVRARLQQRLREWEQEHDPRESTE